MSGNAKTETKQVGCEAVKSGRVYPLEYIRKDARPASGPLLDENAVYLGSEDIPTERYLSAAYHQREIETMWRKTWQVVCHETELSDVGDTEVYQIGRWSILVVRSALGELKAFYNSCRHRGTQLKCESGPVREFRCPYHGWAYALDGRLTELPEAWDFPHVDAANTRLTEVKVDAWGGWIFINMDPDAAPLLEYLGPLRKQFESIRPYRRYVATHAVISGIRSNWKVVQEGFLEVYHCDQTHPQLMAATNCYDAENSVYPDQGHLSSRMIVPVAVPGPGEKRRVTEQDIIDNLFADRVRGQASLGAARAQITVPQLPDGAPARPLAAEVIRGLKEQLLGIDLSEVSDSEVIDAIEYFAFPNFMPWAGYQNCMAYRFRPDGDDHTRAVMDIWLLNPVDESSNEPVPHAPETIHVKADDGLAGVAALGRFTTVLQQDLDNFPLVQRGMETSPRAGVTLANYQEVRIRHFHQVLDRYLGAAKG